MNGDLMGMPTPVIVDTINDDGSVTRVSTTTQPNGDTDVRTTTITAEQYQIMAIQTQQQIDNLNSQITALQATQTTMATNVSTIQSKLANKVATPPEGN